MPFQLLREEEDDLPGIDLSAFLLPDVVQNFLEKYGHTALIALSMGLIARVSIDLVLQIFAQAVLPSHLSHISEGPSLHSSQPIRQDIIPLWLLYLGICAGISAIVYIIALTTNKTIRRFPLDINIQVQEEFPEAGHALLTSLSKPARRSRSRRVEEVAHRSQDQQQNAGTSLYHRMVIVPPPLDPKIEMQEGESSPDSDATLTEYDNTTSPWHSASQSVRTPDSDFERNRNGDDRGRAPSPSRTELEAEIHRLQLMVSASHARQARRRRSRAQ